MELEMIKEAPEFESKVPSHLLVNVSPAEKYMLETLSKIEQGNLWNQEKCIIAYNLAVQHDSQISKTGRWVFKTVGAVVLTIIVTECVHFLLHK